MSSSFQCNDSSSITLDKTISCSWSCQPIQNRVALYLVSSNNVGTISSAIQSGELVAILLAFLLGFIYTDFFTRLTVSYSMLY